MSPAHVVEPTYRMLKRQLLEGAWKPGEKLEALKIADDLQVSMTPVRDCLNRLAGERLVEMQPGEGYRVPRISERALRDMLELNARLLGFALPPTLAPVANPVHTVGRYADRVAALFEQIAAGAGNLVLVETVHSLGERMHFIRALEPVLFPDALHEVSELELLVIASDPVLSARLVAYHESRKAQVAALVALAAT